MEQGHFVSLWVGSASSWDALSEFVLTRYTEDGDAIPSKFSAAIQMRFDEDFIESVVHDSPLTSVRTLLAKHSYGSAIAEDFVAIVGEDLDTPVNAVILLYRLNYNGSIRRAQDSAVDMRFVGAVPIQ